MTGDHRRTSALDALVFGQPGFFAPRPATHWLLGDKPTSYHDTRALKGTLEQLVDFDRINTRESASASPRSMCARGTSPTSTMPT